MDKAIQESIIDTKSIRKLARKTTTICISSKWHCSKGIQDSRYGSLLGRRFFSEGITDRGVIATRPTIVALLCRGEGGSGGCTDNPATASLGARSEPHRQHRARPRGRDSNPGSNECSCSWRCRT
jgi:hypothetical protein